MTTDDPSASADLAAVQANVTEYWDLHAEAYDAHPMSQLHMGAARDAWARVWQGALPSPPVDVLDVGAGTGQVALLLAELGHRVTAIDLAEGMLALARAKSAGMANPPLLQSGDAVSPSYPPGSFDAITNRYLLWTLREPLAALRTWRRLLRPGGVLAAVDSTWYAEGLRRDERRSEASDGDDFLRLYDDAVVAALPLAEAASIEAMASLVREAGFADVRVTPLGEIDRLQREHLPDAGGDLRLQFLITARKA